MATDKYTALWVSHSSISDFQECPRAYYLRNVYRSPDSGRKIQLINPPLTLGQAVHEVIDQISVLPVKERFDVPLIARFTSIWEKYHGKRGGFVNKEVEHQYQQRGQEMIRRLVKTPGPLAKLAVKINADLPYYWLSEEDNIILCGKIDWLEYLEENDAVHIIDFKTGKKAESPDSLQLPIYQLIASETQERPVEKASYWYLERKDRPTPVPLSNSKEAREKVLTIAKEIKTARALERFKCPHQDGCHACRPYEGIVQGQAEFVGVDQFDRELYMLDHPLDEDKKQSKIL